MYLGILAALFLLVIVALLLVPIELCIDTRTHQYYLQLKGLAKASIEEDKAEIVRIRFRILFFSFFFYPLKKMRAAQTKKKKKSIETTTKKKSGRKAVMRKMIRVLRSFTLQKCSLNLDTGDWVLNAQLYPVFVFLNFTPGEFTINFEGKNELALVIRNRPIHIIRSFINI